MSRKLKLPMERDESEEIDLFSNIPRELILEILLKLPAKSLINLSFVSKHWSSIIRDKDFTKLFLNRSFTQPRLLFTVYRPDMHFFISRSLEDPSSDHHHRFTLNPEPDSRYIDSLSSTVRGLICYSDDTEVLIRNLSTGQFVALPRVNTSKVFLGYDPVNDLYKVLCVTARLDPLDFGKFCCKIIGSDKHQVFTLGAKQEWRMIECKHRAAGYPMSKGICMDGVVYYLTRYEDRRRPESLISFNVVSENFDVIKLPDEYLPRSRSLVNYGGRIALTDWLCNGTTNLWILKDASNQEWTKVSLLVPSWENLVENDQRFEFRGTLSTGELIFVPRSFPKPFFIIYYDLKDNHARKVVMEGLVDERFDIEVFLDHVESPMFIPKVNS